MRFGVPHQPIPVVEHAEAAAAQVADADKEKENARAWLDDLEGRFADIIDDYEEADAVLDRRRRKR